MGLKGISSIISPDLLHALCSMGHGDEIVFADVHFPTSSVCRHGPKEIRADGHKIPELLKAVLKLFPLDTYVDMPIKLMEVVPEDKLKNVPTPIWDVYYKILYEAENREVFVQKVERFEFYKHAQKAFAVVHTGETAQYGNIILKKGIVKE